jgi:hypothetical protein
MAEQMQARYPDHGDTLQNDPRPLSNQNRKNHVMTKGLQQCQRGLPCDRNQISRGATEDIYNLRRFVDALSAPLLPP